ncbi:hypothetical protein B0G80_8978 [Paraburkholderia sp. BL6669N2]|nr:hypothetical protein B0G80_8978 [Paraburkholderia sp. BL6669N2]TDY21305.1 hypothetical protein B0G81_1493 [Paraburkholderia sp. BL6665CI2N2]
MSAPYLSRAIHHPRPSKQQSNVAHHFGARAARRGLRVADFVLLVVLGALALGGYISLNERTPKRLSPAVIPSRSFNSLASQCTVPYAALMDLAQLARRYGNSSANFLDALYGMTAQVDKCLSQATMQRTGRGPGTGQSNAKGT